VSIYAGYGSCFAQAERLFGVMPTSCSKLGGGARQAAVDWRCSVFLTDDLLSIRALEGP
jgi:hypothetical protein